MKAILQQQFNGTIIITDPCYIMNNEDYDKTNYGKELNKLGFTTYLVANTGYGDWTNEIAQDSTGTSLGQFCADSGQVCVVLKEEIEKNPACLKEFSSLQKHCYTEIKDFNGVVVISTMNPNWTMIHGKGNIDFHSN